MINNKISRKKIDFSVDDISNIIEKYRSGLSCKRISEEYLCSDRTIRRLLERNNINTKENPNNIFIIKNIKNVEYLLKRLGLQIKS